MSTLRQQEAGNERKMPNLRQRLKQPETYLIAFFLLLTLVVLDTFRQPEKQITGWAYVGAVRIYQLVGRPLLEGRVKCRFQPTCSEYSIEAVRKHGIRLGLTMTYNRLDTCEINVPLGTSDPVPVEIFK